MRLRKNEHAIAIIIAAYARNPYERKSLPNQPVLSAPGRVVLKKPLVVVRATEGTSEPVILIREPPKKLPKPVPKVVSAKPVTF